MKKGEMSMGVIIGAAIALLILVIISVLLFDAFNKVQDGTSCEARTGAYCEDPALGCDSGYIRVTASCEIDGDICCTPVGG